MAGRPMALISGKDPLVSRGGHESYVRAHALAARAAGLEPHVFCIAPRREQVEADFGTVHRVGAPLGGRAPVWLQGPLLAREVVAALGSEPGPHLLHGFAIWSSAAVSASTALGRRGVRSVAVASAYGTRAYEVGAMQDGLHSYHGLMARLRYWGWWRWIQLIDNRIEGRAYAAADVVFVNYESVRGLLVQAYGPGLNIRKLPYATAEAFSSDAPTRANRAGTAHTPLILAASRHDPRKGLDVLLQALARVAARGLEFRACLVGPGRLLERHRRLTRSLGLAGRVSIPGAVEDLRRCHERAEIFVLPSLAEASGSVSVLEALQARTAVIASACDGIPEDLTHDQDALLVPPGDVEALAAAIGRLLVNPDERARLASAGRRTYERRFSAARFSSALIAAYEELGIGLSSPLPARIASTT